LGGLVMRHHQIAKSVIHQIRVDFRSPEVRRQAA
jgi:hypothetical protein